jgi:hypothetical protein
MYQILCMLEREDQINSEDLKDLSVSDIMCYKHAKLINCEVELTFS